MASNQNLGDELECPLCLNYFKVPKVMGTCLHVACLECLQLLVASRRTDFPCPVCREKCKIPTQGIAALKDDFKIRAIVEKYQQLKKEKNFIHCSACPKPASHFCKECGKIYLCIACSGKHSRNPLTNAHELVGVCSKHGKSLTMYCRKCNAAICSVCLIADHASSSRDHDVESHEKVADEEVAEVASAVDKLEKTIGRKENALRNMLRIRDSVVATIDSDLSLLGKRSDSVIEKSNKACVDLKAEKGSIQKQIEALIEREKAVDKTIVATNKKMAADRQKKKEYSDFLNSYRSACMDKFEEAATQAVAETDGIKANVELGRKETSTIQVLDDQTVPTLLKIKERLRQTLTTAEQVDRAAQFVGVEERMPRFVPTSDQAEIGRVRRELYAILKKFADISFPAHRACKSVGSLKHLPDGRLACLYQTGDQHSSSLGCTIILHDSASPAASPAVMDKNIHFPAAMTVTSEGEPMVMDHLGFVSIFNNDGYHRNISLNHSLSFKTLYTSFECNDEDDMFVGLTCGPDSMAGSFCVFKSHKSDGIQITKISERSIPAVKFMSYCRLKRIIYLLAPPNFILRYHWDGTTVTKMQSIRLPRVHGFKCDDICIDELGAVFVAGHDRDDEVHIFQVKQAWPPIRQTEATSRTLGEKLDDSDDKSSEDEGIECTMIELSFEDNVRRLVNRKRKGPVISISGDTLALGHNEQIELFHLLYNSDTNE